MTDTWEAGAAEAASAILLDTGTYPDPLGFIDARLSDMRDGHESARQYFVMIAACSLKQLTGETGPYSAMAKVLSTVAEKQADYGPQNILWAGVPGIVLRMHDKTARIRNLLMRERVESNEPLSDSWLDLVGYSIVGIMLLDGTFERPLNRDLPTDDGNPFVIGSEVNPMADATGDPLHALDFSLNEDPEIREALRQFTAGATKPEYVHGTSLPNAYTIEGGGSIDVYPAPDGSHTHVQIQDSQGGSIVITASAGLIAMSSTERPFVFNNQRLSVVLCMLLGAAEAALDWRNTTVQAEVPREQ